MFGERRTCSVTPTSKRRRDTTSEPNRAWQAEHLHGRFVNHPQLDLQIPNLEAAGSNSAGVTSSSFFPNSNSLMTLFCGTTSTAYGVKVDVVELANLVAFRPLLDIRAGRFLTLAEIRYYGTCGPGIVSLRFTEITFAFADFIQYCPVSNESDATNLTSNRLGACPSRRQAAECPECG